MGLIRWAFVTTGLKSLLSLAGPLLSLTAVTIWVLSSVPMVNLTKRRVTVFVNVYEEDEASPPSPSPGATQGP